MTPTRIRAGPVAYGGMEENMGLKNRDTKNKNDTIIAA
jgi:hypothetical protein